LEVGHFFLQLFNCRLLGTIFSNQISILEMHSFSFVQFALQLRHIHLQLTCFFDSLVEDLSLSFALNGELIEFLKFFLVRILFFFGFSRLVGEFH